MDFKNKDKELREIEQQAEIKYEKYRPKMITIKCQKCGSTKSLMKIKNDGEEFWFCRDCVIERAKQLKKEGK